MNTFIYENQTNLLEMEDFKNEVMHRIFEELGDSEIEFHGVQKDLPNGIKKEGFVFTNSRSNVSPVIYMDSMYDLYKRGETIENIVAGQVINLKNAISNAPDKFDIKSIDLNKSLYLSVMNYDLNKELLTDTPHEQFHDLALVPRLRAMDNGSIRLTNELCTYYQKTGEEILEIAKRNNEREVFTIASIGSMLTRFLDDTEDIPFLEMPEFDMPMYVVTRANCIDGAASIASKTTMEHICDSIGDDAFYILPSSRDELIVVPYRIGLNPTEAMDIVRDVNISVLSQEDFLSNNIYLYQNKKLTMLSAEIKEKEIISEQVPEKTEHRARSH